MGLHPRRRFACRCLAAALFLVANGAPATAETPSNPILVDLLDEGVPLRDGQRVKLPHPTMADGLATDQQHAVIESVSNRANSLERMLRDSIVAPISLEIKNLEVDSTDSRVRAINLSFVAHGSLDAIYSHDFLEKLASIAHSNSRDEFTADARLLEASDLTKRDLFQGAELSPNDHWFHGTFAMFDRVYMSATRHATSSRTDESITLASKLAPEFLDDDEFPNQWQSITRNDAGAPELGSPLPYASAAFFVKVTRLKKPAGACFIEYHHVFEEPTGWFDGKALLRSKLPLIMQNRVRAFRRQLAVATDKLAAP